MYKENVRIFVHLFVCILVFFTLVLFLISSTSLNDPLINATCPSNTNRTLFPILSACLPVPLPFVYPSFNGDLTLPNPTLPLFSICVCVCEVLHAPHQLTGI